MTDAMGGRTSTNEDCSFPPCCSSTSDGEYYILVIGGYVDDHWTTTVELFQVKSRGWYELTDLPHPLWDSSATVCGNHVHVIGRDCEGFSCSLQDNTNNITVKISYHIMVTSSSSIYQ